MTIPILIDKQDTFEIVRDQIAAILVAEIANQQALATAAAKDSDEWKLRIYVERNNPWETWLNDKTDRSPIINIWFDNANFEPGKSNVIDRQWTVGIFNIDCYGFGMAEDVPAGGHLPGDKDSAFEVHRALRLVRNILMAAEYSYLGLRPTVGKRWPQAITSFQPQIDNRSIQQIVAARMAFRVEYNEFSPQVAEETLDLVSINVLRVEDGQIVLEADYASSIPPPALFIPLESNLVPTIGAAADIFTRGSIGWSRDSSGYWSEKAVDTPRFHYDNSNNPLGILIEGSRTNSILNSRNFGAWPVVNTPTVVQDQIGIDGVANTAWSITDNDPGSQEFIAQTIASMANSTNVHCAAVWVRKDSDTTRFPGMFILVAGGAALSATGQINTKTGATVIAASTGTATTGSIDMGDWWLFYMTIQDNGTGNITFRQDLIPASGVVFGISSAAAVGTAIFDQAQVEFNASFPSSPLPTTIVPVTRAGDKLDYTTGAWLNGAEGSVLCEITTEWITSQTSYFIDIGDNAPAPGILGAAVSMFDGTNIATGLPFSGDHNLTKIGARWSASDSIMFVAKNGVSSVDSVFDGDMNIDSDIHIGRRSNNVQVIFGTIKNVAIYDYALSNTQAEVLTN